MLVCSRGVPTQMLPLLETLNDRLAAGHLGPHSDELILTGEEGYNTTTEAPGHGCVT